MRQESKTAKIGIVAGGPAELLADLSEYQIDFWIGCDRGALYLINNHLPLDLAIGDFDSVSSHERELIEQKAKTFIQHPVEKDETDLELAINEALKRPVCELFLFGVTGGRKDHELSSLFLLERLIDQQIKVKLIDKQNSLSMYRPGRYHLKRLNHDQKVSFLSLTSLVTGLTLENFYYPLEDETIRRGDSLTISNHLIAETGYFSFDSGILIVIKTSERNA